jgi:8-oxo-dGTP pyrophosphatase MutT (NUDIX family)
MSSSYYRGEAVFSAGGVLVNEDKRLVLLVYKETNGEWLLPKGHMEEGETIEETAQREIFEETGYKIESVNFSQYR